VRQTGISASQRAGYNADQFRTAIQQALYGLRVAMPCIIQEFDADTQTVSVIPAIMEKVLQNQSISTPNGSASIPTPTDLPWMRPFGKIPLILPGGGNFILTTPVAAGDECLVVFGDMCIDQWWQAGGTNNVQLDKRRHDLSDGFAILKTWSQQNLIEGYNQFEAELRTLDGSVKMVLGTSGIVFKGDLGFFNSSVTGKPDVTGSTGGNAALQSLLAALAGLGLITNSTT
jgi:hypothetical protein